MKIAYVYDAVYPWEKGGAQKRIWEMARRLATDHDVHLYGMHYWDGPSTVRKEGVTLHGVCEPMDLYVDGRRSIPQAIWFAGALAGPLLREEFDVVDCQQFPYFPCLTSKAHELLRGTTYVVTWYEVWDDYWYDYLGYKGVFGRAVERLSMALPREIVAISDHIRDDLAEVTSTPVSVVPNGVDYGGIQEAPQAEADWDVVYVGRLSEHKNVDVLLDAVAVASDRLDDPVQCAIVGDGPEREALEAHAETVGVDDHVRFLGFVEDDDDVIGHMKAADVFVLPSMREGFPNTILEANACGVPSVVIDHEENGATAVVHDDETGYVTDLSADAIADRVVEVLTDPAVRRELQSGARQFARDHDWDRIVDRIETVYRRVTDEKRATTAKQPVPSR